jgi:riboflavin synthase
MNMFTGIVQGKGTLIGLKDGEQVHTLTVQLPDAAGLERGASVALNGVCLTATDIVGNHVAFDVIPETLERTTLGRLKVGDEMNVERSLKMGDELGGHLLSGHIMAKATVVHLTEKGEGMDFKLKAPVSIMKFIHEKGYIGLNGASLTVGRVDDDTFSIHLIPETLRLTTFASLSLNDEINVEIDSMTQTIVATVERMMKQEM